MDLRPQMNFIKNKWMLSFFFLSFFLFAESEEGKKESKENSKKYSPASFFRVTESGNRKLSIEPKIEAAFQNLFSRIKESFLPSLNCYAVDNSDQQPTLELKFYSQKKKALVRILHQNMELGSETSYKIYMSAQEISQVCDGIEQLKALAPSAFQGESNDGTLYNIKVDFDHPEKKHFKSIQFLTDAPRSTASIPSKKNTSQKKEIKK
jgi:hypothetical protein